MERYVSLLHRAFENAENGVSKITKDILALEGMSGSKTRHFYNNLLNAPEMRYLEIGTWKGSSVCSAMCGNSATVVCIDNWSEFGDPKKYGDPKGEFLANFQQYKGTNNATFIENDCFRVDVSTLPKFNIYLFDGNHDFQSHERALTHYLACLDDLFIFIVDDWNWEKVRTGTRAAIQKLDLTVLYEKEIRLTWDDSHTLLPVAKASWWNGIYVAVLQKPLEHKIN